jgi:acyl-coenzyme A thioesterase PaaI-like protein
VTDHEFDRATQLTRSADDGFAVTFSDQWGHAGGVNGGFMLAACVKAIAAVLPFPDPIVVSGMYLRPGNPGPSVVAVEPIRAGRTTAFAQARLSQFPPGAPAEGAAAREVLRVTAAFADVSGATPQYAALTPPKLPDPADCEPLGRLPDVAFSHRFAYRVPVLPGWAAGKPSGEPSAEFWIRFADGRPADTLTLPLIVDAAAPAVLELGARSTTIELTVHVRARPAPGWLACRAATRYVSGGYHEEDFEIWDSAGTLVAQSRQLALLSR